MFLQESSVSFEGLYYSHTFVLLQGYHTLQLRVNTISPAENQFDLEMAYKVFSLVILVGKTLPIQNLTDDTLSSLSNLRKSRCRPIGQAYKENACSVDWITPKIFKMDSFPPNS